MRAQTMRAYLYTGSYRLPGVYYRASHASCLSWNHIHEMGAEDDKDFMHEIEKSVLSLSEIRGW